MVVNDGGDASGLLNVESFFGELAVAAFSEHHLIGADDSGYFCGLLRRNNSACAHVLMCNAHIYVWVDLHFCRKVSIPCPWHRYF